MENTTIIPHDISIEDKQISFLNDLMKATNLGGNRCQL